MNKDIENIIKKNLPEKKRPLVLLVNRYQDVNEEFNECLSQINTKLIADEVLKVVKLEIEKMDSIQGLGTFGELLHKEKVLQLFSTLSPNKENKNNE